MDSGPQGFPRLTDVLSLQANIITVTPPATTTKGALSIGDGPFDGRTVGFFAGSSLGTLYAGNSAAGYTGNLIDLQLSGVSKFSVTSTGALTAASTITAGTNAAPFPLTFSITKATSTTNINSSTAFFDGPTVTVAAGTWLLIACITVLAGVTIGRYTYKLWDGTTVITSSETTSFSAGWTSCHLAGVVSPVGSTTYKMSIASTVGATSNSTIEVTCSDNGTGTTNTATWIVAVRLG